MRRRFGRLALTVGALAVIVAWIARQRKAADALRESYETARVRFEEARVRLSERVQERGQETGEEPARGTEEAEGREEREDTADHREYFRNLIEETNRRAAGKA